MRAEQKHGGATVPGDSITDTPQPFKMPAGKFMTVLALTKLLPWIAVAGLLLALSIIPSVLLDIRWIVLPLILLFLIVPGVISFLYISYGTLPGYYQNISLHTVTRTDGELVMRSLWHEKNGDNAACKVRTHRILLADLQPPQQLAGGVLWLYKNRQGFVWIPN